MNVLTHDEVKDFLTKHLKNWHFTKASIQRDFKFRNFVEAFSFMTAVALEAEKMDHHPEWSNTYNTVHIALSTHSPKGITHLDLDLAGKIDHIDKNL